jgi:triacylglycerol esterase/lipase EstA (alpha/beta hydrolase family)
MGRFARLTGCLCVLSTALAAAPAALAAGPAALSSPPIGPEVSRFVAADLYATRHPEAPPPGSDDWSCVPVAAHPDPVVLVHGSYSNAYATWAYIAPALASAGYCVFALNYGGVTGNPSKGTGDIRESAKQLGAFVDRVLASAEASKVDIVGYSQGGLMPHWYLRFDGGADPADPARNKVAKLITLGATSHGTTVSGLAYLSALMRALGETADDSDTAARQQEVGSPLLRQLNAGGDTEPGVAYTAIATRYDAVSTPYRATFLKAGPGATVDNITLQDGCEIDHIGHIGLTYDPRVLAQVLRALDPAAAPREVTCVPVLPIASGARL